VGGREIFYVNIVQCFHGKVLNYAISCNTKEYFLATYSFERVIPNKKTPKKQKQKGGKGLLIENFCFQKKTLKLNFESK
jgi:hypothetical protein